MFSWTAEGLGPGGEVGGGRLGRPPPWKASHYHPPKPEFPTAPGPIQAPGGSPVRSSDWRPTVPRTRGGLLGKSPTGMLRDTTVTSSAQLQEECPPVSDTLGRAYCSSLRKRLCSRSRLHEEAAWASLLCSLLVLLLMEEQTCLYRRCPPAPRFLLAWRCS